MQNLTYGNERLFLIVADQPAAASSAAAAIADIGGRVSGGGSLADAAAQLRRSSLIDDVVIELSGCDGDTIATALPTVWHLTADRAINLCIAAPADQIDIAWTVLPEPASTPMLLDPDVTERVVALAALPRHRRLNDASRGNDERRRQLVNQEVTRFAETLIRLTNDMPAESPTLHDAGNRFVAEPAIASHFEAVDAGTVRSVIRSRRMRAAHFPADLFADPAWDMLLDLFAAELEHRRVSVSSLCIAAAVPGTTALRWIGTMVDARLFERQADLHDRRRAYVALSDLARRGMHAYFDAVRRAGLAPA